MKITKYKQNDLFRGTRSSFRLNACVGKNGGPYDFLPYATGYFLAGSMLIENLKETSNSIDILIYPICYSFRHGIELYLKYFLSIFPKILQGNESIQYTHKLIDNWHLTIKFLRKIPRFDEKVFNISQAEKILKDFIEIDPSGEMFRFPKDKKGKYYLQETSLINVIVLGKAMKEFEEIIELWGYAVDDLRDHLGDY